ncbi:MAG: HD domain-containing phosphohydrolase [Acidobacteriota bacterium]
MSLNSNLPKVGPMPPLTSSKTETVHEGREPVLVVDDEPLVRSLLCKYLLAKGFVCSSASTGAEALEKLEAQPYGLVITDIHMPGLTGVELLAHLRRRHPNMAVIMITGMAELDTAVQTLKQGASDYLTKPFNLEQVTVSVDRALHERHKRLEEQEEAKELRKLVRKRTSALTSALRDVQEHRDMILEALVKALDARENETHYHSQRVRAYTQRLAQPFQLSEGQLLTLGRGALLHDIGKIGVSDAILLKPSPLTEEEWAEMKQHPVIGYEMLQGFRFLRRAARLVLHHHERFDGTGYPYGLKKQEIPLAARLFSVSDAYDAITSDRPYRRALDPKVARNEIIENSGTQFDPEVVEQFLRVPQEQWDAIRAAHH